MNLLIIFAKNIPIIFMLPVKSFLKIFILIYVSLPFGTVPFMDKVYDYIIRKFPIILIICLPNF